MEVLACPLVLITDFGHGDAYVGQLKAVLTAISPGSPIIDLTHEVAPYAIDEGAWHLECALPVLPERAVVVAVVDPGVGTARKPLAIASGGRFFVGPDNGLLSPALPSDSRPHPGQPARSVALDDGPPVVAHELTAARFRRPRVSDTFHGRDVFAPAAAALAQGVDIRRLGPPVASLHALPRFGGEPAGHGRLEGYVIRVDRYGNVVTTIRAAQLFPACRIEVAGRTIDTRVRTFAEATPGTLVCHCDSSGFVAIAMNQASAAAALGVTRGSPVSVVAR